MVPYALFHFHKLHEGPGKSFNSVQLDGLCYLRCPRLFFIESHCLSKDWKVLTNNLWHVYPSYLCGLWYTMPFTKWLGNWIVFLDFSEYNDHTSYTSSPASERSAVFHVFFHLALLMYTGRKRRFDRTSLLDWAEKTLCSWLPSFLQGSPYPGHGPGSHFNSPGLSAPGPVIPQQVWSPAPRSPALSSHGSHWAGPTCRPSRSPALACTHPCGGARCPELGLPLMPWQLLHNLYWCFLK